MPIFRAGSGLLLFAHVPKCAGLSVSAYLAQRFGVAALSDTGHADLPEGTSWTRTSPQHVTAASLRRLFPAGFFDASFAMVREPAARIRSAFHFQRDKERKIAPDVRFDDWVEGLPDLVAQDPWAFDGHVRPMVEFVPDDARSFRLEEGFGAVTDWLATRYGPSDLHVPAVNGGIGPRVTLSDRARGVIETLYAEDYRRFGYPRQAPARAATATQRRGDVLLDLGLRRFRGSEMGIARRLFDAAVEADPDNAAALASSSVVEALAGQPDRAASRAAAALAQDAGLADAHLVRVRCLLDSDALDQAAEALAVARRHLGDQPSLDLLDAMLASRRGEVEIALATCAAAVARAIGSGATVLRDEAMAVWRRILDAAQADEGGLHDLIGQLALTPAEAGLPTDAARAAEIHVIRLEAEDAGGVETADASGSLPAGPDPVRRVLAHLQSLPPDATVVLVRARDEVAPEAIAALATERARTGWAALGTVLVSEPDLAADAPAPAALRDAVGAVFAATARPGPKPLLVGGAVALHAATLQSTLERLDAALYDPEDILPAATLALTEAGQGVATWAGAVARPRSGQPLLSDAALGRLCQREGDLRALLAVDLAAASDPAARRLGVALAAVAVPDRPRLLAAMVRRACSDLPVALRAQAFADLWSTDPAAAVAAFAALERGFARPELLPFALPVSERPDISIIIPAHNQIGATYATLSALRMQGAAPPFEVILVDDGSVDETRHIETIVGGLRVLRHDTPRRFIAACNAGAAIARGGLLVFLNNDTEPAPGWLAALRDACDAGAGLAGARLVRPDGRLQEAGGLIDDMANPAHYGAGGHPLDPRYSCRREADYLSGAALMVSRTVWERVGGFSTYLDGMYFEDTDLACKVRAIGLPVVYAPAALVIHHEGTTAGRDVRVGPKALQEVNRPRFQNRWRDVLRSNPPADMAADLRADHRARGRILFVDYAVPRPDNDAGGHASFEEMRMMAKAGWKVTFVAADAAYLPGYVDALQAIGVEVLHHPFVASARDAVARRGADTDILYISRHWLAAEMIPVFRGVNPSAPAVVNVADLHFLRELRTARTTGDAWALESARRTRRDEIAALSMADLVLCYNETETAILWEASDGTIEARLCPWVETVAAQVAPLSGRSGLSFLGGFGHPPNLQGLRGFVSDVLPLLPGTMLDVFGSGVGPEVEALASAQVRVRGFAPDVTECFAGYRVFIAPLLAGAGIKGKVIKALCHGIPCVLTPVAAEGLGLVDGVHALIAETPAEWAGAIQRLLTDDALWHDMAQAGLEHARRRFGSEAGTRRMEALLAGLSRRTGPAAAGPEPVAPVIAPVPPASLGAAGRGDAPQFALHFEVQHFGSPDAALWLADLLAHPRHGFHLNLDGDEAAFAATAQAVAALRPRFARVGLTRSPALRWGGPSIHLALVDRLRQALSVPGWDYVINLSGACAPLRGLDALDLHLSDAHARGIRAHCFFFPLEDGPRLPVWPAQGTPVRGRAGRAELRGPSALLDWFRDPGRNPILNPGNRLFVHVSEPEGERHLLDIRPLTDAEFALRRRLFGAVVPQIGRAWYVLHRSVAKALVDFIDAPRNAGFVSALLPSVMPEEHMIQTILANGLIVGRDRVECANLHRDNGAPRVFTDADMDEVLREDAAFFLRKLHDREAPLLRDRLAARMRAGRVQPWA